MRFRLAAGERSSKYRPGQFVSHAYAERYATKVVRTLSAAEQAAQRQKDITRQHEAELEAMESDFWEVTVFYEE